MEIWFLRNAEGHWLSKSTTGWAWRRDVRDACIFTEQKETMLSLDISGAEWVKWETAA